MEDLILRFAAAARAAGLRVSTSEVLDCLRHLELVGLLDEPQFKTVLQANFAKSRREQVHFERLYRLFFHELRQAESIAHATALAGQTQAILAGLTAGADGPDPGLQALLDFMAGDPAGLLDQIQRIGAGGDGPAAGLGANLGAVTRRLGLVGQINALGEALAQAVAGRREELGWEDRRDLAEHFQDRLAAARRLVGETTGREAPVPAVRTHRRQMDELGEVHFASLTAREVEAMRQAIEQLVRRIKDRVGLRYAARKRGALDVKKTLRRAAATQGVPLAVFYRRRPPRKAKIVTLCDVSGSVWSAARFMLNMLYSLQECFTQVRSFIFVAGVEEVTDLFEDPDINRAIDRILKEAGLDYNAATDYGRTFREFKQGYLDILNPKTTLIVIGDGRSNYTPPEEGVLAEMRARCRRLIWLNPETEQFWYTGDSEMRALGGVCDEVRPCQNLNQLLEFITSLVL